MCALIIHICIASSSCALNHLIHCIIYLSIVSSNCALHHPDANCVIELSIAPSYCVLHHPAVYCIIRLYHLFVHCLIYLSIASSSCLLHCLIGHCISWGRRSLSMLSPCNIQTSLYQKDPVYEIAYLFVGKFMGLQYCMEAHCKCCPRGAVTWCQSHTDRSCYLVAIIDQPLRLHKMNNHFLSKFNQADRLLFLGNPTLINQHALPCWVRAFVRIRIGPLYPLHVVEGD